MQTAPRIPFPGIAACLAIVAFTFLLRLPWFFPAVIDWDESIFILMGREVAEGYLPYIRLWDIKPPGLHFVFGFFVWLGQSITGIRLLGAAWVALAGIAYFLLMQPYLGRKTAFLSALTVILFSCALGSGYSVMGEHAALPALCILTAYYCRPRLNPRDFLVMGLLVGAAGMMRTNLFVLGFSTAILALAEPFDIKSVMKKLALLGAGAALFPAAIIGLYWESGHIELLYRATVLSQLDYIDVPFQVKLVRFLLLVFPIQNQTYPLYAWLLICAGGWIAWKTPGPYRALAGRLLLLLSMMLVSIFLTGGGYSHYMIQTAPMVAPFAMIGLYSLLRSYRKSSNYQSLVLIFITFSSSMLLWQPIAAYGRLHQAATGHSMQNDVYELARRIEARGGKNDFFACNIPILYFLTGSAVPVYIAPPAEYARRALPALLNGQTPYAERSVETLIQQRPRYITMWERNGYYDNSTCEREDIAQMLKQEYSVEYTDHDLVLWKKN